MEEEKQPGKISISDSKNVVQGNQINGQHIHIGDIIHQAPTPPAAPGSTADAEAVRQLIGKGKTEKAIEELQAIARTKGDAELLDDATLLSNQWKDLSREKRLGLLSSSEASVRSNRITLGLLELLKDL